MVPWDDKLQVLEVIGIIDETPDVKTFRFRSDNQTWFRYKPGQFITLELPVEGGSLLRTYTLSSSPSRPFSIAVTAKLQADSIGTRWMFDHLKVGDLVKAYGPAGTFSLHNYPSAKYLFISAGSGITPMMSMLRWLNDCSPQTDIAFVNSARRPEEIIFRKELELLGTLMLGCRSVSWSASDRAVKAGSAIRATSTPCVCRFWPPISASGKSFAAGLNRSCRPCARSWPQPAST